jgi:hypothetical protein
MKRDVWSEMLRLMYECGEVDAVATRNALSRLKAALGSNRQTLRLDKTTAPRLRKKKHK